MLDRDPRRLAAWAAATLLLVLLSAWYLTRSRPAASAALPPAAAIAVGTPAAAGTGGGSSVDGAGSADGVDSSGGGADRSPGADGKPAVVDVAGAVKRPGVYNLTTSDRVEDALRRAGGPTRRADLSRLNRAAKLEDGRQILVPIRGHRATAAAPASTESAPAAPTEPVDLNSATLEELDTLDGVGPATAKKILEYREQHGGFHSVDELDQIAGIGEKRLAALREHVRV